MNPTIPTPIRTTPMTSRLTELEVSLTPQVRIAPRAMMRRLTTNPMPAVYPRRALRKPTLRCRVRREELQEKFRNLLPAARRRMRPVGGPHVFARPDQPVAVSLRPIRPQVWPPGDHGRPFSAPAYSFADEPLDREAALVRVRLGVERARRVATVGAARDLDAAISAGSENRSSAREDESPPTVRNLGSGSSGVWVTNVLKVGVSARACFRTEVVVSSTFTVT